MVFSSVSFLLYFFAALLVVYFALPQSMIKPKNALLLLFSLAFYAWGGLRHLPILLASILINYLGGLAIDGLKYQGDKKIALVAAAMLNLGLLVWFKYAGFFSGILAQLIAPLTIEVALPIGISFYTFQGMSYVIDVYRGDVPVQKNPLSLAFYISFFPQLVAGPIVRYRTIAEQIEQRSSSLQDVSNGMIRFILGLGKKMLLANPMGLIANQLFLGQALSVQCAWIGAIAYSFQIYFDFSAYSDMAIGMGKIFGFSFMENFNYPYISQSISEFWRRWHISLSSWFRDYLYIPLGGNRCSAEKHIRNIVVVWLLTGLWHGAAWSFVLWGAWYCALLLGEKYLWGKLLAKLPAILRHGITLLCIVLGWVLFRAESASAALAYAGNMFGVGSAAEVGQATYLIKEYWPEWLLCAIAALPVKNWAKEKLQRSESSFAKAALDYAPMLFSLLVLALSYMKLATGSFNPFIYFRF